MAVNAGAPTKVRKVRVGVGRSYRKKTLRQMPPVTRELARLRGELASVDRRLKNLLPKIQEVERLHRSDMVYHGPGHNDDMGSAKHSQ